MGSEKCGNIRVGVTEFWKIGIPETAVARQPYQPYVEFEFNITLDEVSLLMTYTAHTRSDEIEKPNIVFVVGDDVGYDDISLHGSDQILTPNIDMIGYQGVIIENYYTDCYGTPAISALLTGKLPIKTGTQGPSIGAAEDRGVPLSDRLLPSYLKDLGYISHYVGKWPLGRSRSCYLPMKRGFESFYGFTSSVDYYMYNHVETFNGSDYYGLDLFNNFDPVQDQSGHLTNVLTERALKIIKEHNVSSPLYLHVAHAAAHVGGGLVNLQAPGEDVAANSHIAHSARRLYAGLVTGVDKSVGKVVEALAEKNMLKNTLIIFVSDNGAQSIGISRNYGSNLPLRGAKGSPWEGAVRSTAVLWHLNINPKIWKGMFHVTDWLPTLVTAAGGHVNHKTIDGVNQWYSITKDEVSKRRFAVIAVDDWNKWGAFRDGDYKIIIGNVPNTCGYYGHELSKLIYKAPVYEDKLLASKTSQVFSTKLEMGLDVSYALEKRDLCNLNKRKLKLNDTAMEIRGMCVPTQERGCLYNITEDPTESHDLWDDYPEIVQHMVLRFRLLWAEGIPRMPPFQFDPRADPSNNSYVWFPWLQDDEELPAPPITLPEYPMRLSSDEMNYYMKLNVGAMERRTVDFFETLSKIFVDSIYSLNVGSFYSSHHPQNDKTT